MGLGRRMNAARRPSADAGRDRTRSARWLPTRRSVTGAILVAVAASGVLVAHRSADAAPSQRWVVLTGDVPAGHAVTADDLGTIAIDLPAGVAAISGDEASELIGRVTRSPGEALDLLRPSDLHEPGRFARPGSVELALELSAARALSGTVRTGDLVDVLATDPHGTGTHTVATRARVSHVHDRDRDGIGASGNVQVRLEVADSATAADVVDASIRSELSLVLPAPTQGAEER